VTAYSAFTDEELSSWLRWALDNGSGFLQRIAESAMVADIRHYHLMRPILLELMKECPKPV